MNDKYNSYFFNQFYEENGGGNYTDKENWTCFFSNIADKIIEIFGPKTVLDAGCAMGYLVEALRNRGVEAYGIDISEYAIKNASDTAKPYIAVHSVTERLPETFPDRFDLIITMEVLEHLFPEDGEKAIKNLCSYSDTIIFTSTPDDIEDKTHYNVRLSEHWCRVFAKNSFYHDLFQPMDFICPWAMLFRKNESFENVVFEYEKAIRIDKLLKDKDDCNDNNAVIYFDTGEDFSDEGAVTIPYHSGEVCNVKIDLPKNCVKICLAPAANNYAVIKIDNAVSDRGSVKFTYVNGFPYKNGILFSTYNPNIHMEVHKDALWLKFNMVVSVITSDEMINFLMEIYDKNTEYVKTVKALEKDMELSVNEKNILSDKMQKLAAEAAELERRLEAAGNENRSLNSQLIISNETNNAILNSTCWKITKPLRMMRSFNIRRTFSNLYKRNVPYSIDKITYNSSLLNLRGWIFSLHDKVRDLKLVIETGGNKHCVKDGIFNIERNDVFNAYDNENALYSGFEFRCLVSTERDFTVFLECEVKDGYRRIKCGSFKGTGIKGEVDRISSLVESDELISFEKTVGQYMSVCDTDYDQVYTKEYDVIIAAKKHCGHIGLLLDAVINSKAKTNITVIDSSYDENTNKLICEYAKKHDNITLIKNDGPFGPIKYINEAINNSQNDVILLDGNIMLPDMWLERLVFPMLKYNDIAAVTPFTNEGSDCDFPEFFDIFGFPEHIRLNELFGTVTVDKADGLFKNIKPMYVSTPASADFCMAMSRRAIQKIGAFDEKYSNTGSGEDIDWSRRAVNAGYRNAAAENLFVLRTSYGKDIAEERERLIDDSSRELAQIYENYGGGVVYTLLDPHKKLREFIAAAQITRLCKECCFIIDCSNEGSDDISYIDGYKKEILGKGGGIIELFYDTFEYELLLSIYFRNYRIKYKLDNIESLDEVCSIFDFNSIVVNNVYNFKNTEELLEKILDIRSKKNVVLTYVLNNYYALSPSGYIDEDTFSGAYDSRSDAWRKFIEGCDSIIAFSEESEKIFRRYFKNAGSICTAECNTEYMPVISKDIKTTNSINVGIYGNINNYRSVSILKNISDIIKREKLNIKLIAAEDVVENLESASGIKFAGKCTYDELPRFALENDIDVFFDPSVYSEDASFRTCEILKMGYPAVVFDTGILPYVQDRDSELTAMPCSPEAAAESFQNIKIRPSEDAKRILFVSDSISYCSRYRVEHFMEELALNNVKSDFIQSNEASVVNLYPYYAVVIYRSIYTNKLDRLISEAHAMGKKVYFDVDDLVFNYNRISDLEVIGNDEFTGFKKHTEEIYECMSLCDGYITSTETLKKEIKNVFPDKKVCVNRNVISLEMLTVSNRAKMLKPDNGNKVILGYFSGSRTHNRDFDMISDVLLRIMRENENVYIEIGGLLEIDKRFDKYKNRIIRFDFCDWKKLPELISSVDINLMPLEQSIFHECKSENKWTEAAAVGVCTVGSYNKELALIIKTGENGFLCSSEDEWYNVLTQLVNDKDKRNETAENAYRTVIEKCTVITADRSAQRFILDE